MDYSQDKLDLKDRSVELIWIKLIFGAHVHMGVNTTIINIIFLFQRTNNNIYLQVYNSLQINIA